jgi:hypothetical protein
VATRIQERGGASNGTHCLLMNEVRSTATPLSRPAASHKKRLFAQSNDSPARTNNNSKGCGNNIQDKENECGVKILLDIYFGQHKGAK